MWSQNKAFCPQARNYCLMVFRLKNKNKEPFAINVLHEADKFIAKKGQVADCSTAWILIVPGDHLLKPYRTVRDSDRGHICHICWVKLLAQITHCVLVKTELPWWYNPMWIKLSIISDVICFLVGVCLVSFCFSSICKNPLAYLLSW